MTTLAIFDTLAISKRLEKAGFTQAQAEEQAKVLAEVVEEGIATKQDIAGMRGDVGEVKKEIEIFRADMKAQLDSLSSKLEWLTKLIGIAAFVVVLLGYFKH